MKKNGPGTPLLGFNDSMAGPDARMRRLGFNDSTASAGASMHGIK